MKSSRSGNQGTSMQERAIVIAGYKPLTLTMISMATP